MHQPYFSIVAAIITFLVLRKANGRDPGQHRKLKILHAICVMFVILISLPSFSTLGWAVSHPDQILEHFYVRRDIFPPWASFFVWSVLTILSLFAATIGFGLAKRADSSRRKFLWLMPALAVFSWLEALKGAMRDPLQSTGYVTIGVILVFFVGVPFGLLMLFYTRRSVIASIFSTEGETDSNKTLETTPEGASQF